MERFFLCADEFRGQGVGVDGPKAGRARNPDRFWDKLMPKLLFILSSVTILTTLGIVLTLVLETTRFFQEVSLAQFFLDTRWTPLLTPQHFGIWPLICGTLLVTGIAVLIAIPIGLGSAIYLSEYAPESVRRTVKPVLEILAGIPTIVYGYFALNFLTADVLKKIFPRDQHV